MTTSVVAEIAGKYDVERIVLNGVELDMSGNKALINNVAEVVKTEVPFIKTAEQPTFVNSVDEMTDSSKAYVMPDGYLYGYKQGDNYNLLKTREVQYSSRLQDDAEGIISSTNENIVTGWIPVEYGKYYAISALYPGDNETYKGTKVTSPYPSTNPEKNFARRINAKKADGTVIVGGEKYTEIASNVVLSEGSALKIVGEDIIAVQLQIYIY